MKNENHKYYKTPNYEPFILEPEDWNETEWATLCKVFGLDPTNTDRIKFQCDCVEHFGTEPLKGAHE